MTRRSAGVRPYATSLSIGRAIHRVRGRCTRTRSERAPSADLWVEWCSTRLRPLSQVAFARPASAKIFHGAGFDPQVAAGRWRYLQAPCARSAHPTPSVQGGRRSIPTGPHCHTGASLTPLRLVKVCSARALAHSHSVVLGACTLGSVGRRSRTRLRPGRPGAAGSRKSPTYSRGCKQATSVLSEWPSTEVPSGPRRLRVACFTARPNTILNFVVKARMEIRASAASSNRLNT